MRKKLLLSFSSILFALFLSEAGLQIYYRINHGSWVWQKNTFKVNFTQPVADRRKYNLRPGYADISKGLTINERGFRGTLIESASTPIIVALGDSVPFGFGVRDDETYPAKLDSLYLSANTGLRVLNAGISSYNLRQSFDRFRLDVIGHYKSIELITIQAANDVALLTYYKDAYNPDSTWVDNWRPGWSKFRESRFAIPHYINRAISRVLLSKAQNHEEFPGDRMLSNVKSVLEEGLKFCSSRSIPVVLLPIDPFYYQTKNRDRNEKLSLWNPNKKNLKMWDTLIDEYNKILAQASQTHPDVFFFDTRAVLDNQDREKMYIDFIHYSPKGHEVIANSLLEFISTKGLISAKR